MNFNISSQDFILLSLQCSIDDVQQLANTYSLYIRELNKQTRDLDLVNGIITRQLPNSRNFLLKKQIKKRND